MSDFLDAFFPAIFERKALEFVTKLSRITEGCLSQSTLFVRLLKLLFAEVWILNF